MNYEEQIAELWERIMALEYEVNNIVKNENGNINQKAETNKSSIDEHSTAIDDLIIAITPTEAN